MFLLLAAGLISGCASDPAAEARDREKDRRERQQDIRQEEAERRGRDDEPSGREPKLGMTRSQIREMYGEPKDISRSARGEVWQYWFNRGHMFIPYNFGYKPRMGTFTFNGSGHLVDFSYNQ